ncbi:MAG: hypothetical protein ACJARR_001843 [Pseudophaeobacter arcticus]|jgi:hypothetical protein
MNQPKEEFQVFKSIIDMWHLSMCAGVESGLTPGFYRLKI